MTIRTSISKRDRKRTLTCGAVILQPRYVLNFNDPLAPVSDGSSSSGRNGRRQSDQRERYWADKECSGYSRRRC